MVTPSPGSADNKPSMALPDPFPLVPSDGAFGAVERQELVTLQQDDPVSVQS
jgi:hypothetical protein